MTPVALGNSVALANRIPVVLRHLWPEAMRSEDFVLLLSEGELPSTPPNGEQQADVWLGFYHRKHELRK